MFVLLQPKDEPIIVFSPSTLFLTQTTRPFHLNGRVVAMESLTENNGTALYFLRDDFFLQKVRETKFSLFFLEEDLHVDLSCNLIWMHL